MSYDISFRVKVEDADVWLPVGECHSNITYNMRELIHHATGLQWLNCENNGLCTYIIPCIRRGLEKLRAHPERYKKYESPNGWGTVQEVISFFAEILEDWDNFVADYPELANLATFWIT